MPRSEMNKYSGTTTFAEIEFLNPPLPLIATLLIASKIEIQRHFPIRMILDEEDN